MDVCSCLCINTLCMKPSEEMTGHGVSLVLNRLASTTLCISMELFQTSNIFIFFSNIIFMFVFSWSWCVFPLRGRWQPAEEVHLLIQLFILVYSHYFHLFFSKWWLFSLNWLFLLIWTWKQIKINLGHHDDDSGQWWV